MNMKTLQSCYYIILHVHYLLSTVEDSDVIIEGRKEVEVIFGIVAEAVLAEVERRFVVLVNAVVAVVIPVAVVVGVAVLAVVVVVRTC